jgi:methylmalonyl-CoA mutase cobalamin-binding domain/chain
MSAALLKPLLLSEGVQSVGKVVLGTVKGDLHDIGKNIVKMMMEGKGLEVYDLGVDVSAEQFVAKAMEVEADVVALSALLTTTMTEMKAVVQAFEDAGIRDKFKILVGGGPVTQEFCDSIGADCYTADGASAADAAAELCTK